MSSNEVNLSPADATARTNIATFLDTSKTIIGVTPTGQWVITDGQPASPPKVTPEPGPLATAFTIEFDAGRKGSSDVAQQFNTLCGGADHMWGIGATIDSTPSELNFYFGLILQLQGSPPVTVYLAQGSVVSNNWWIGGGDISADQLEFFSSGNLVALDISGSGSNGFVFNASDGSKPSE